MIVKFVKTINAKQIDNVSKNCIKICTKQIDNVSKSCMYQDMYVHTRMCATSLYVHTEWKLNLATTRYANLIRMTKNTFPFFSALH